MNPTSNDASVVKYYPANSTT